MPVTRERIVAVALELLDEGGLDGLTLRRLADRLGIRAPTLYWHVRNKRELLDLLAAGVGGGRRPGGGGWPGGASHSQGSRGGSGWRPGPGSCAQNCWPTGTAPWSSRATGPPAPACPASSASC